MIKAEPSRALYQGLQVAYRSAFACAGRWAGQPFRVNHLTEMVVGVVFGFDPHGRGLERRDVCTPCAIGSVL